MMERNFEWKRYGDLTACLIMRAALDQDKLAELVVQVQEAGGLDPARRTTLAREVPAR